MPGAVGYQQHQLGQLPGLRGTRGPGRQLACGAASWGPAHSPSPSGCPPAARYPAHLNALVPAPAMSSVGLAATAAAAPGLATERSILRHTLHSHGNGHERLRVSRAHRTETGLVVLLVGGARCFARCFLPISGKRASLRASHQNRHLLAWDESWGRARCRPASPLGTLQKHSKHGP